MSRRWMSDVFVLAVLIVVSARELAPLAAERLPVALAYRLSANCVWAPRPWARMVGIHDYPSPNAPGFDARYPCLQQRGLKSWSPDVKIILRRFPHEQDQLHAQ